MEETKGEERGGKQERSQVRLKERSRVNDRGKVRTGLQRRWVR